MLAGDSSEVGESFKGQQWVEHLLYTPLWESLPRHVVLTFILVGFTAAVGLSTGNLELVLGIEVIVAHD